MSVTVLLIFKTIPPPKSIVGVTPDMFVKQDSMSIKVLIHKVGISCDDVLLF